MQIQLGIPSEASTAAIEEAGVDAEGFEQLFALYGHGNSDTNQVNCEYLTLTE